MTVPAMELGAITDRPTQRALEQLRTAWSGLANDGVLLDDGYGWRMVTGASTSVPTGLVYTLLPMTGGSVAKTALADECFRANADGTLTILQAGWYAMSVDIFGESAMAANLGARASIWVNSSDTTPSPPSGYLVLQEYGANTAGVVLASLSSVYSAGADYRIGMAMAQRDSVSRSFRVNRFGIVRIGGARGRAGDVGATGPAGSVGPTGPPGTMEVYVQPTEPVGASVGAIWIEE